MATVFTSDENSNKVKKFKRGDQYIKKFYSNNRSRSLNGFLQMIDKAKSKRVKDWVYKKAKALFGIEKAKGIIEKAFFALGNLGLAKLDDLFWDFTVNGKLLTFFTEPENLR